MAKLTDDPDHWRHYRHLRNKVHKETSKDRKNYLKDKLSDDKTSKDKLEVTKELLGWKKNSPPSLIID